ncbi:glycosyltransferase [Kutzneria albida]|uniref:Sterol 3-beta-glucosyltransferase n=1 Tax=Kutzneria albida DSM 43870 TaxID=1449976 RepID=W5W8Y7_9PSEU|nr:glycosyltransferase [Kutzneria albida]AHH97190.1 Sterol 3-beta-glucosyltransferase [Kutzneria albida DSM 43870]
MTRILIMTSGSHGDVAPYAGLGARLRAAGHEVGIAAADRFGPLITSAGLDFHPLSQQDPRAVAATKRGQAANTSGPRGTASVMRIGVDVLRAQIPEMIAACSTADVIMCSLSTLLFGAQIAEAQGSRFLAVPLQTSAPTRYLPPSPLGGRDLGPWANKASATAFGLLGQALFGGVVRDLRAELGLSRRARTTTARWTVLHGVSPTVVPRPPDWPRGMEVVGYWWPPTPADWRPSPELVDFLAAGPPPVYIGFGSMGVGRGERLGQVVRETLRSTGFRAIVHRGWAELAASGENVCTVDHVPHEWLLPHVSAVVHHAGAGTTAAGLRAGVPAVPVPLAHDQPFWARRLVELGVAPAALPLRGLRADRLGAALAQAVGAPAHRRRAETIARRIAQEDGAGRVAEVVDAAMGTCPVSATRRSGGV